MQDVGLDFHQPLPTSDSAIKKSSEIRLKVKEHFSGSFIHIRKILH